MRIYQLLTTLLLVVWIQLSFGSTLPSGFIEQEIATGLNPVSITKGLNNIVYITEKNGKVKVVQDDVLLSTPLLDIEVNDFNERGLISIALHPDFFNNGYFYAYYCPINRNKNRVVRFTATNNGKATIPGSAFLIIELDTLVGGIHNGGCMKFGSDGKLYIATGEGGLAANSKTLSNTLGKMLRLNDDGTIPTDNPFYNDPTVTGINKSIYAYGFRNPFAFDFDAAGQLYTTDVGGGSAEEVNKVLPGKFYGWPDREGNSGSTTIPNYQGPEYFYSHSGGACAIVGCVFYNPINKTFPAQYHGQMFFGDYCTETIYSWNPVSKVRSNFATGANRPLWYVVADNGAMYYIERNGADGGSTGANTASYDGKLWKIIYSNSQDVFINKQPQNLSLVTGENAVFSIIAYSNLQPLSFQWYKNNVLIPGANNDTLIVQNVALTDNNAEFKCLVSNSQSSVTSNAAKLTVIQNTRPVPVISSPSSTFLYKAGDVLSLSGSATDAEDGAIPGGSLTFWVDLHHDTHTHPALSPVGGAAQPISFTVPNNGETSPNVFLRVYLRATDAAGFSSTTYVDVHPQLVGITVNSNLPEATINYDGTYYPVGQKVYSVTGIMRNLEAPMMIQTSTKTCIFDSWSTGLADNLISFATPALDLTITATYDCDDFPYSGDGLTGNYSDYSSISTRNDAVRIRRVDPQVNFNWIYESPDPSSFDEDNFKATWDGYINIPSVGSYTFYLNSFFNDICSLTIDGVVVINKAAGPNTGGEHDIEASGTINFATPGKKKINVSFQETDWIANIQLRWAGPSITKQVVPESALFVNNTAASGNGLMGSYLGTAATLNSVVAEFTEVDETINFNWGTGSPNAGLLGNDLYTVTWKGFIRPPVDDNYTFTVSSDDGFLLMIDNDTIINRWYNGVFENKSKTIPLLGRTFYPIELRYFENTGDALIKMEWASAFINKSVVEKKYLFTTIPVVTSVQTAVTETFGYKLARDGSRVKLLEAMGPVESFVIYNVNGTEIFSGKDEVQHEWIDLNNQADGLYLLQIVVGGKPTVFKILK